MGNISNSSIIIIIVQMENWKYKAFHIPYACERSMPWICLKYFCHTDNRQPGIEHPLDILRLENEQELEHKEGKNDGNAIANAFSKKKNRNECNHFEKNMV